jgi:hypothetical protein
MKILSFIAIIVFITACSENTKKTKENQLAGMYKLYINEIQDSTGIWHEDAWTKGGTGYIVYDGLGHMAIQITPKGYKDYEWLNEKESINRDRVKAKTDSMSVAELKAAVAEFSSSFVYVANYSVEDTAKVVQHHRISASIPSVWGTTVRRSFTFSGDTLILLVLNSNRRLKWIKQP